MKLIYFGLTAFVLLGCIPEDDLTANNTQTSTILGNSTDTSIDSATDTNTVTETQNHTDTLTNTSTHTNTQTENLNNGIPYIEPIANITVYPDSAVFLTAVAHDSDGEIESFYWSENLDYFDKTLELENSDQSQIYFTAPRPDEEKDYEIYVHATDNDGNQSEIAYVTVTILAQRDDYFPQYYFNLNDTGMIYCPETFDTKNTCTSEHADRRDAVFGRDVDDSLEKVDDGDLGFDYVKNGFDYSKVDAQGNVIPFNSLEWSCILDNHTGLMWGKPTQEPGLLYYLNTYTMYKDTGLEVGEEPYGVKNGGTCTESECDTQAFIKQLNTQGLCGHNDWSIPNFAQLLSVENFSSKYGGTKWILTPTYNTPDFDYSTEYYFWTSTSNKTLAFKGVVEMRYQYSDFNGLVIPVRIVN